MSSEERGFPIRRIVVALDTTARSVAQLEAIADLAVILDAELIGVFVEDVTLLRVTKLPFAHEVGLFSASLRQLQTAQLERQLRAQARWIRQALSAIAERRGLPWSFHVVRGVILAELLKMATKTDLVVWNRISHLTTGRRRRPGAVGGIFPSLMYRTIPPPQRWLRPGEPILLVYDGSTAGQRALGAVMHLAKKEDSHVVVVLVAKSREEAQKLRLEAGAWLRAHGILGWYQWLDRAEVSQLASIVASHNAGTIILPVSRELSLEDQALQALLDVIDCPLWLIR